VNLLDISHSAEITTMPVMYFVLKAR